MAFVFEAQQQPLRNIYLGTVSLSILRGYLPQSPPAEYDDARQRYTDAMHTLGYQADLAYNIALCYFKDKQYAPALKHVGELTVPRRALEEQDSRYEVGTAVYSNN